MLEELPKYFLELLKKIPKQLLLPILVGIGGLILFGYGLMSYFNANNSHENTIPEHFTGENTNTQPSGMISGQKKIIIDVEGAVQQPGVYSLAQDSRVKDGLIAAGGLSDIADRTYVEQRINLAAKLADGMKVYIPREGENASAASQTLSQTAVAGENIISINAADQSSLESLPGIGVVTAQKIIDGRPYETLDELVSKHVLTQKVFDKIKDMVGI